MIDVLDELADGSVEAHTSIVLTYNVDLLVYDKLIRRRLASAGVTSQIVFCDATPYAAALDAVDSASRVGRAYSVTPIRVPGAFHPKAYLLLGRRSGLLVLGSGNASLGGLVRNAELFGRFSYNEDVDSGPHPAFRQVFDLAKSLGESSLRAVRTQLTRAEHWTPWLAQAPVSDGRIVRIGGPGHAPLVEALRERSRVGGVRRVVAVSSTFDRKLDGARALSELAAGDHETVVVVDPERLTIDGHAVGRLGGSVKWTEFVDPRPSKKKAPRDSYLHAKLVLIETERADHLFFGSANVSRPALLTGDNVEIVVELPPVAPGTWITRLALGDSVEVDVRSTLEEKRWIEERDPRKDGLLHMAGVEWSPGTGWFIRGEIESTARLALGAQRDRPDQILSLRLVDADTAIASAVAPHEGVRFGWLLGKSGNPVSSFVALTWPEVARARLSGWFGARVEQAILGMKDGELLGHVLFEFLDRVPDLGVLAVTHLGRMSRPSPEDDSSGTEAERTEASFFTEATAASDEVGRLALGDRSDLDILASLVQPLDRPQAIYRDDEDEEEDDDGIEEEAERRGLDTSKKADGSERVSSVRVPSAKRMYTAGRRFSRRVERAASALGETLGALEEDLVLPPGLIARQVWMTFIAAFVAGRSVETSDQGEQTVVEADVLAHYVMRCAASLAGDGRGGLLRHMDTESWPTRDGQALADGLRFFVAVCSWAVAWFEESYERPVTGWTTGTEPTYAKGIHDAIPLFVLARLLVAAGEHCAQPDFPDAARRTSAWDELSVESIETAYRRAQKLAAWLRLADADPTSVAAGGVATPGSPVVLRKSGVGIVLASRADELRVVMLSRPGRPVVPFKANRAQVLELPDVGRVLLAEVAPELLWA